MSNAKWRKLLSFIDAYTPRPKILNWKFVDNERLFKTQPPLKKELLEASLSDGRLGPVFYDEIEWLEIESEDVERFRKSLEKLGKFDFDITDKGLRVYGYGRLPSIIKRVVSL